MIPRFPDISASTRCTAWGSYFNLREFLGRYGWQIADTVPGTIYNYLDKGLGAAMIPDAEPAGAV